MAMRSSVAGSVPAPEFPLGLDWLNCDRPFTFSRLRGKIVVLDFWTYGCINCMHIIPDLKKLEREYPNELVVIGVHSAKFANERETENIRRIILRYGLEHPVVNDRGFQVWQRWGVRAWPTLMLIDPLGNVVGSHSGEGAYRVLKPAIEALIREFDARGALDRTSLHFRLEREGLPESTLAFPGKVLAEANGTRLFIADTSHHRLVIVAPEKGEVLAMVGAGLPGFVDGDFETARFTAPQGMAFAEQQQALYVADTGNHAVRRVDLCTASVTTLVGTGRQSLSYPPQPGTAPQVDLSSPWDVALENDRLLIAMAGSHQLWAVDLGSLRVEPFAGSGREGTHDDLLLRAELAQPSGLALDGQGRLYFADSEASTIRWAETQAAGKVVTLAGSGRSLFDFGDRDGIGADALLQHPLGVAYRQGYLYVADTYNNKIKRIDPSTRSVHTLSGSEAGWRDGDKPLFYEPGGLSAAGDLLFVADTNNHAIRIIDLQTLHTTTLTLNSSDG